jgi:hemin uptake protein HemP
MPDRRGQQNTPPVASEYAEKLAAADTTASPPRRWCEHDDGPCHMCAEIGARVVRSDELLQGARELFIVHGNQVYRLLRTRNDKLILQK